MRKAQLLDAILEMSRKDLREHIREQCVEHEIELDLSDLGDMSRTELYDFIADHIHPEFQAELHSECQDGDFSSMHPSETAEEFWEHEE